MLSGIHLRCHTSSNRAAYTRPKLACSTHSRTHRRPATRCVNGQGAHIACASSSHADDSTASSSQQQQQAQPEQLAIPAGEPFQQQEAQSQQTNMLTQPPEQQQQHGDRQQELLLPPVTQDSSQQPASRQQQLSDPHWDWDAWVDHFGAQDQLGSQLDDACLELEEAVAQEDYAAAAELKRSILSLLAQDTVAEMNRSIQEALQAEDYSAVARLRKEAGAWLEGWWTCTNKRDGQLLRIAPEYGRWTARAYTAKDLAVIKGLVDEETAAELLEQIPTNQLVAAAATATARVVASLCGEQQQSKGHEQLQRALLLLGTPQWEVFVRPTGDTCADDGHAHGSSSSSSGRSSGSDSSDSNGSTVAQSSSSSSSVTDCHGLTEQEQQQQQQQYVMQAVGLGSRRASDDDIMAIMKGLTFGPGSGDSQVRVSLRPSQGHLDQMRDGGFPQRALYRMRDGADEDGQDSDEDGQDSDGEEGEAEDSDGEEGEAEDSDGEAGEAGDSAGQRRTGLDSAGQSSGLDDCEGEGTDGEEGDEEGSSGESSEGKEADRDTFDAAALCAETLTFLEAWEAEAREAKGPERWPLLITALSQDTMHTSPGDATQHDKAFLDKAYRRLTRHTSSSMSTASSSSSSDPLQGLFLGPAYLDRDNPQLLLLQMGRCPDSNKQMLLGTTVTGSAVRPARELVLRADLSPQSDTLPVELFPSTLGVTSRHPAEVWGMNVIEKTWVHAELLQLKQGKVRNEMTDGAQLGLLWKHEGSSKHVMVLLHRVVLEEL